MSPTTSPEPLSSEGGGREGYRAGHVALAGVPNVGKSTLLNAWIGEHLSIVSEKPQTTRERVFGICTRPQGQVIFVDTPGLLEPRHRLHESMQLEAEDAIADADLVLYVCEAGAPGTYPAAAQAAALRRRGTPLLAVANKIDLVPPAGRREVTEALRPQADEVWCLSAQTGEGLAELLDHVLELLPPSPPLYPTEELATQPLRFFVEEYVREAALEVFAQEVPHSIACRVEEFREDPDPVYIRATIFVERESQKGIVVGRGGDAIRRLGTAARAKIEALVGRPVYLDLWVKVLSGWRKSARRLRALGYRLPPAKG